MNWNFWGDPAMWLWGGVWVASVGGVWLVVKGLRGMRVASTACAGCGYDLVGTVSGPCPECGRRDGAVGNQVRKWRWGLIGVGLGALAVGSTSRVWVEPAADWIWTRVLPVGVYMGEYERGGLRWRWWAMREDRKSPRELWDYFGERHEVLHPRVGWIRIGTEGDPTYPAAGSGPFDFDGDGTPERVLWTPVGGAHNADVLHIINTQSETEPVIEFEGTPLDVDGDGIAEIEVLDRTFDYWNACYGDSPSVKVLVRRRGGEWRPAVAGMRMPAPSDAELVPCSVVGRERPLDRRNGCPVFWERMIELMYSGNEATAWLYFDRVWPDNVPGKVEFKQEFVEMLEVSPWWPKIREAYARGE